MNKSRFVARGGLITALAVIFVYMAYLLPSGKLAASVVVSFLPLILLKDRAVIAAISSYVASAALILLLVPNLLYGIAYGLFFGLYPIIRHWFDHVKKYWAFILLLTVFCEGAGIALYFIAKLVVGEVILPIISPWLLALIAQIAIVAFIWIYEYGSRVVLSFVAKLKIFK